MLIVPFFKGSLLITVDKVIVEEGSEVFEDVEIGRDVESTTRVSVITDGMERKDSEVSGSVCFSPLPRIEVVESPMSR